MGKRVTFWAGFVSAFSAEPEVHEPRHHARNQKNNQSHKVNAFDLLFVDGFQNMVESGLLPNDAPYVVHFKETDQDEPKDREDEADDRYRFSSGCVHR